MSQHENAVEDGTVAAEAGEQLSDEQLDQVSGGIIIIGGAFLPPNPCQPPDPTAPMRRGTTAVSPVLGGLDTQPVPDGD